MSVKLIQNFDYFESFSLNGNAAISDVHRFGSKSVTFSWADDYVSVSNNSGLFNLDATSTRDFECFLKPAVIPLDYSQIAALDNSIKFFNGHAYKLIHSDNISWHNAKSQCETLGGHLATSTSKDKNDFLASIGIVDEHDIWLGGTDEDDEGNWSWINDENWNYSNWENGQPNEKNNHNFLELYGNGLWNNTTDTSDNPYFICEWDNLEALSLYIRGYRFFNGHSFKLFHSDNISWHDAKSQCETLGGHFATSTSSDKNDFLNRIRDEHGIWLGATDENNEGNWQWVTGEDWSYSNWEDGQPNNKDNAQHFLVLYENGVWNDLFDIEDVSYFVCEWDCDFRSSGCIPGHIFNFDNALSLTLNADSTLLLSAENLNINSDSTLTVSPNSWHHIRLRVLNATIHVYLDGNLAISADIHNLNITPSVFTLGGFSGYIDEFAVSYDCNSLITAPNRHFEVIRRYSSAPVNFALWSCNNLPDGLTLSENGLLSGTPTVTGTFNCNISLNTNWGTTNKSIRIVIN